MRRRFTTGHGRQTGKIAKIGALFVLACVLAVLLRAAGVSLPPWNAGGVNGVGSPSDQEPVSSGDFGFGGSTSGFFMGTDSSWNEEDAPNYYLVSGPANISRFLEPGDVRYEPLDAMGRASGATACVDVKLVREGTARERKDISDIEPSGWGHNQEVDIRLPDGDTYHGYFWNRSHLLAKSLGGDEVEQNLVCATRMQNVGANKRGEPGGMAYPETLVRDWLDSNPNGWVWYAATPVYYAAEPVCRCVMVDVLSSDRALDMEIAVFNAAKGYEIDYETGTFHSVEGGGA